MLKRLPNHHIKLVLKKKKINSSWSNSYLPKSNNTQSILLVWGESHPVWTNSLCARSFAEQRRSRMCPNSLWTNLGNQSILPAAPSPSIWEGFPPLCCASRGTSDSWISAPPSSNTLTPIDSLSAIKVNATRVHKKGLHDSTPPKCRVRPTDNKSLQSAPSPNDVLLI